MKALCTGRLAVLLLLLAPPSGLASADGWDSLEIACSDMIIPGWEQFLRDARTWQKLTSRTQGDLSHLKMNVCPEYLQSANGAAGIATSGKLTLERYVAEQSRVYGNAITSSKNGKGLQAYLNSEFKRISAISAPIGYDFASFPCGQGFLERRKHVGRELGDVENRTDLVRKECPALAERLSFSELERKRREPAPYAASGSGVRSENNQSEVTGELRPDMFGGGTSPESLVRAQRLRAGEAFMIDPAEVSRREQERIAVWIADSNDSESREGSTITGRKFNRERGVNDALASGAFRSIPENHHKPKMEIRGSELSAALGELVPVAEVPAGATSGRGPASSGAGAARAAEGTFANDFGSVRQNFQHAQMNEVDREVEAGASSVIGAAPKTPGSAPTIFEQVSRQIRAQAQRGMIY